LPEKLPTELTPLWKKRLRSTGVGGIAATTKYVIVSGRELNDSADGFRCFSVDDGTEVWKLSYPIKGDLDYGNSPRATPQIYGDFVYLMGAFGHLHCLKLATGDLVWKRDLRQDFQVTSKMVWGHASSPLIVDDRLIVNGQYGDELLQFLTSPTLSAFDVIFFAGGHLEEDLFYDTDGSDVDGNVDTVKDNLKAYVKAGGIIYASD